MKRKLRKRLIVKLVVLGVLAGVVLAIAGCELIEQDKMSKSDRLKQFVSDINNDNAGGISKNLSSNASAYATANLAFWENHFGEGDNLDYSNYSESGDDVTATFTNSDLIATSYTFEMEEKKTDNFVIRRVYRGGTTIFQ